jgi:hypothetical protein
MEAGREERSGEGEDREDREGMIGAFHGARVVFQTVRNDDGEIGCADEP